MHDVPPPEAFEPTLDDHEPRSGLRRRLQTAVVVILVAALVILAAVEGGGYIIRGVDEAPPTREPPRLTVVDGSGNLLTLDEAGGSSVDYQAPNADFLFPAWSPDGSRIAAIGSDGDGSGVYVFRAQTTTDPSNEPLVVYESAEQPPFYLYWTPDSRQLTFLTTEADGLALRIAPASGSAAAAIIRTGSPMYWDFVDPTRLLVHSGTSGPEGFFGEVGLDGSPFEGTERAAGVFRAPTASPGGRYRAYLAAVDDRTGEVVREARDGSGATRIRVFGTAAMSFSPAGEDLAFVALDQPTSSPLPLPIGPLRVLRPGASDARTLHAGSVVAFFWSPTGEQIAILMLQDDDDNVTEARLGRSARRTSAVVTAPGAAVLASRRSPGSGAREAAAGLVLGLAFVDVSNGEVISERGVRLSEAFINQVLPFFDQYALSHRFWSPDGRAIVLPVVGPGDVTQVTVIPAAGTEPRVVTNGEMAFWSH